MPVRRKSETGSSCFSWRWQILPQWSNDFVAESRRIRNNTSLNNSESSIPPTVSRHKFSSKIVIVRKKQQPSMIIPFCFPFNGLYFCHHHHPVGLTPLYKKRYRNSSKKNYWILSMAKEGIIFTVSQIPSFFYWLLQQTDAYEVYSHYKKFFLNRKLRNDV